MNADAEQSDVSEDLRRLTREEHDGRFAPPPSEGSESGDSESRSLQGPAHVDFSGVRRDEVSASKRGFLPGHRAGNHHSKSSIDSGDGHSDVGPKMEDDGRKMVEDDDAYADANEDDDDGLAAAPMSTLARLAKAPPTEPPDFAPLRKYSRIEDAELDAWLQDGRDSAPALCCAGCCSLLGFLVALFSTITPFWVWSSATSFPFWRGECTMSTGGYAVASQTIIGSFSQNRSWVRQWTYWTAMPILTGVCSNETTVIIGSVVSGSMYDDWGGKYGFCSDVDGEFTTPASIIAMQICSTFTTFATLGASCFSCTTPSHGRRAARSAGSCALVASLLSICTFVLAISFPWYKDLRAGDGFMPMRYVDDVTEDEGVIAVKQPAMGYGPAFIGMALVAGLCLISAGLFFVSLRDEPERKQTSWMSLGGGMNGKGTDFCHESDAQSLLAAASRKKKEVELTDMRTVALV